MPLFFWVLLGILWIGQVVLAGGDVVGGEGSERERWLVMFRAGTEVEEAERVLKEAGLESFRWIMRGTVLVVRVDLGRGEDGLRVRRNLASRPEVRVVEPDLSRKSYLRREGG